MLAARPRLQPCLCLEYFDGVVVVELAVGLEMVAVLAKGYKNHAELLYLLSCRHGGEGIDDGSCAFLLLLTAVGLFGALRTAFFAPCLQAVFGFAVMAEMAVGQFATAMHTLLCGFGLRLCCGGLYLYDR